MRNPGFSARSLISRSLIALTLILSGQIAASYAISRSERQLNIPGLPNIPGRIDEWSMSGEQMLDAVIVKGLQPDDYILRDYLNTDSSSSINLFVAYFRSLQNTYGPHSPRVCLPGNGWLTRSWKIVTLPIEGRPDGIPVNHYVLERNGKLILVVYWYQNDRRIWANEFQAKLHLLPDLLRYRRSDVSLVRIVTPVAGPEAVETAWRQSATFARALFPSLVERMSAAN